MWYNHANIYQIYPLGLCNAEKLNERETTTDRIWRVYDFIPHIKEHNFNTILFNPLFESDSHGYDTRDMRLIDRRLGKNEDLVEIARYLHIEDIKIIFDGVFHHVGRGFFAFQDLLKNRENSPYKDWFYLDFNGNTPYNDGFYYEPWEGHYELVKLRLENPEVRQYIFDSIADCIINYKIKGLRLDVAYCLDSDFLKDLHNFCHAQDPEFFLIGEMIHGDYKRILNPEICHSVTNYECAKGLISAFNSYNLFEIAHSLQRQFNDEPWALYHGINTLLSFVDNHDIDRAASAINDKRHLPAVYTLMFTQPGIPCVYYGSEWAAEGRKEAGDDSPLRPAFEKPQTNEISKHIKKLCGIRKESEALAYGNYRTLYLTNRQFAFQRQAEHETLVTLINADDKPAQIKLDLPEPGARDLLSDREFNTGREIQLSAFDSMILKLD